MEHLGNHNDTAHPQRSDLQTPPLPSPSQLQDPAPSLHPRSNTPPPLANTPSEPFAQNSARDLQSSPTLQSLASTQPSWHLTSNLREESRPSHYESRQDRLDKRIEHIKPGSGSSLSSGNTSLPSSNSSLPSVTSNSSEGNLFATVEDGVSSTSDFVKKLYNMLEDPSSEDIVSWGSQGNCFIVKDVDEFTKSLLPQMFKHSNFASFVRQLNKYDFHKVKNTDDFHLGEHSWTFRHPSFNANQRDALENIKRKLSSPRKSSAVYGTYPVPPTPPAPSPASPSAGSLQALVHHLTQSQEETTAQIDRLERNYQDVLIEMVDFQRSIVQQDGLMENLIQSFLHAENEPLFTSTGLTAPPYLGNDREHKTNAPSVSTSDQNPFLLMAAAQRMLRSYSEADIARSLVQMSEISKRSEVAGMSFNEPIAGSSDDTSRAIPSRREMSRILAAAAIGLMDDRLETGDNTEKLTRHARLARIEELQRVRRASIQGNIHANIANEPFAMDVEDPEPSAEEEGRMNQLAGMRLTDEQYVTIMQNMSNDESLRCVTEKSPLGES